MRPSLQRHPAVGELVTNGWIHLFALDEDAGIWRRERTGEWTEAAGEPVSP